jgi:hypothetical protein
LLAQVGAAARVRPQVLLAVPAWVLRVRRSAAAVSAEWVRVQLEAAVNSERPVRLPVRRLSLAAVELEERTARALADRRRAVAEHRP